MWGSWLAFYHIHRLGRESFCLNVANFTKTPGNTCCICVFCFLPVCWATSTSKMDGVLQCVLQQWVEGPVCSNNNPVHLCYSHLSALHSSGRSAALSHQPASESHLQPQFRTPAGQMLLECCCKQLCHVIKAQIMWASEAEHPLFHRQPVSTGCLRFCGRLKERRFYLWMCELEFRYFTLPGIWQSASHFSPFPIFPLWVHAHLFIPATLHNFPMNFSLSHSDGIRQPFRSLKLPI